MRKIKPLVLLLLLVLFIVVFFNSNFTIVNADELENQLNEQLENLDLSDIEELFFELDTLPENFDFLSNISSVLKGEYTFEFETFIDYGLNIVLLGIRQQIPIFIGVIVIAALCGLIKNINPDGSKNVSNIVIFAALLAIVSILFLQFINIFNKVKITIDYIAKLTEIISPIMTTLLVASGANVSATIYAPSISFFLNIIISALNCVVLPMSIIIIIFSLLHNISDGSVKLNKFIELFSSINKWVMGLIVTVFSVFLSIQGITCATHDGISLKAAKYAISNSIPIVGGFLRDGFDVVVAGTILIKNAIGLVAIFGLFYIMLSTLLSIAVFSLLLKATMAVIDPITDERLVGFCSGLSKGVTYLISSVIISGVVLFMVVLLMTISASVFI